MRLLVLHSYMVHINVLSLFGKIKSELFSFTAGDRVQSDH